MNTHIRWLATVLGAAILLTLLIPPWSDGRSTSSIRTREPLGWSPIFAPPKPRLGIVSVDLERLLLEWAAIAVAGGVAFAWISRDGERLGPGR